MALLNRDRANSVMDARGVEALIATSKENVEYAAGFHSHGQWLMPATHVFVVVPRSPDLPITLVVGYGELDVVASMGSDARKVVPYGSFYLARDESAQLGSVEEEILRLRSLPCYPDAVVAAVSALKDLGLSGTRIGLDEYGMRPELRDRLRAALPGVQWDDGYASLQQIRMVKTPDEQERLGKAVEIAEHALLACVASFREGADEHELLRAYEEDVLAQGGRITFAHILVTEHGALSNGYAGERRLRKGDWVRFDVGCGYREYNSDIARTVAFGEPDEKLRTCYGAILAGEDAAFDLLKPGVTAGQLFDAAVEATRSAGIPHYERHHVGHGIGIEMYDPPIVSPGVETLVEADMVLNIETPYYQMGWGGVQVEDTVVVTSSGYRLLTKTDRGLMVV
jgi:Xaa-Pro aminopeptidase